MKSFISLFFLILFISANGVMGQSVSKMEYFFDTDPGYGNGQNLSLSAGQTVLHSGTINTSSLSDGVHRLYYRAKQNGVWSQTHSQWVGISSTSSISKGEYFFDTDPGFGSGTAFNVGSGTMVAINLSPNISGLSNGIHTLYVRVFNGVWSETYTEVFGVYGNTALNSLQTEYFFDTDPGFGNGQSAGNLNSNGTAVLSPDISSLNHGLHTLYFRVKGAEWSQSYSAQLLVLDPSNVPISFEYFLDIDPGMGNAIPLTASSIANGAYSLNTNVDLSSVESGIHTMYIRVLNGVYSQTYSKVFAVLDNTASQSLTAEYFYDIDPGYGNATSVNSDSNGIFQFSPDISSLSSGIHTLYIRPLHGTYGMVYSQDIFVTDASGISAVEYYLNNDPGYGNAAPVSFSAGNDAVVVNMNALLTSLSAGYHQIGIRTKSSNWSQTYVHNFYVSENQNITAAEYFFNTDPGYGNGTALTVSAAQRVSLNISPDVSSLSPGYNRFYVRVQSGDGQWSIVHNDSICIAPTPSFSCDTVCAGTNTSFTNLTSDADANTLYAWDVDGDGTTDYTSASSFQHSYTSAGIYTAQLIVAQPDGCADTLSQQVVVGANVSPSVQISATDTTLCAGNNVTFTASPTHGGSSPTYQWKVNGSNAGSGSANFSSSALQNGDVVTVEMTSSESCASPSTATATGISMVVNPLLTPSVILSASDTTICAGSNVTFTASPNNGGSSPTYQWKVNGSNAGSGSANFSSSALQNGDVVTVEMTSSESCASPSTATASGITMIVNPILTPIVSLSASDTTICAGSNVTFTASPTNGGSSPTYQWKVNGSNAGSGSANFSSSALQNGDVVMVEMTSSESCASPSTATASGITMIVNPLLTPIVSLSASDTTICAGSNVTFTASPTNGGSSPTYQWKVNGSNAGSGSANFSSSALQNGDVVTVEMTSSESCASPSTATATGITMVVNPILTPSISLTASDTTICAGSNVTFTASPTNGGSSPTYQWKVNGSNAGSGSANFSSSALQNGDVVTVEMTSSESCASPSTATATGISMVVNPILTPSVSLSASDTIICAGSNVTFTALPTNGGSSPIYQWKVNGSNAGSGSANFSSSALQNGDVVTVEMTSSESCASPSTATATGITMVVNPIVTPSLSIQASNTTICTGMNVSFSANPVHGGANPVYQWKLNGNVVGTNSAIYSNSSLQNNDVISLSMISSESCVSVSSVTATDVTMQVSSTFTPSVSISTLDTVSCAGSPVLFTANPVNGGASPQYQWLLNGSIVGGDSTTFVSSTLQSGDSVQLIMTSSETCASPASDTSDFIVVTVNPLVPNSVSLSASDTTICAGSNVTFTASTTNGGSSPTYQWKVNGSNAGSGSANFSSTTLQNGDVVTVEMTSSENCASPSTATASGITMIVNPLLTPSVILSASDTTICAGSNVTFTASPNNGGSSPTYQWKVNGSNAGSGSANFSSTTLQNGDVVTVEMTSSKSCASPSTATASGITMIVNPLLTPIVSLSASDTTICAGSNVTFTASPTNGGSSPTYQWKVNGYNAGSGSATFSNTTLQNGDVVTVEMTSSESCASPSTATATGILMVVNPLLTPIVSLSASDTTICAGSNVTFTASPTNGGSSPTYQWKVNGSNAGSGSANFSSSALQNGDVVTVEMTSSESCASPSTATASGITMIVNPLLTPSVSLSASDTTICAGSNVTFTASPTHGGSSPTYQWKINGSNVGSGSANFSSTTLQNGDVVTVEMTSSESCVSPSTATATGITMVVNPIVTPSLSIQASNTTICTGMNVTFSANPVHGGANPVYQWKLNGNVVGTNSAIYSNSSLQNNDVISLSMISSESCVSVSSVTATDVTMQVSSTFTPSVSISTLDTVSCAGSPVLFTANPVNGGASPQYQWLLNGSIVGGDSTTFVSSTLQSGDSVQLIMTSSETCASPASDTSDFIVVTVNPIVSPSVSVWASDTTICQGTTVDFTAVPINGGLSPSYEWKLNGLSVGSDSVSYSTSNLQDGDSLWVVMHSSELCAQPDSALASALVMQVNTALVPSVSVWASDTTICQGTTVDFTAMPVNGGLSPSYEWKLNGLTVGSDSVAYSTSNLQDGDSLWVVMHSSELCAQPDSALASALVMQVNTALVPSVSVWASDTTICQGTTVDFTAVPINGGLSPSYEWKLNGLSVGSDSVAYSTSNLQDGDSLWVVMHSSELCAQPDSALASALVMQVNTALVPSVSVWASDTTICQGTTVDFTAMPVNEGLSPSYEWKLNGLSVGSDSVAYSTSNLQDGDSLWVVMHSSALCAQPDSALANPIKLTVYPIPATPVIIQLDTLTLSSSVVGSAYEWFFNGALSSYTTHIINPTANGAYQVLVIENGCKSDTSQVYNYFYDWIGEHRDGPFFMLYPNPNNGQFNLIYTELEGPNQLEVYNSHGAKVWSQNISSNAAKNQINIDLRTLAKGMYYVRMVQANRVVFSQKVLIQ